MEMLFRFTLFAIGFWKVSVNSQSMIFNNTLCPGVVYIRTSDMNGKSWSEAQKLCRNINSTLPIIDTPDKQSCFTKALGYFQLTPNDLMYVWIGGNSSGGGSDRWRWLNETSYSGQGTQFTFTEGKTLTAQIASIQNNNTYQRSYAFASRESNSVVRIQSSVPTETRFYICRYENPGNSNCKNGSSQWAYIRDSSCSVRYNETLSWFGARNRCLLKDGDLATFSNVSLLSKIIPQSDTWWIGLTSSRWTWQNAMSGETKDVTFTQWTEDANDGDFQPNGDNPQCISTSGPYSSEYVSWRDYDCNEPMAFICQITSPLTSTSTLSPPLASSLSSSRTTGLTATDQSPDDKGTAQQPDKHTENDKGIALGVGIGVGVGVPVLLALIALIVFLALRDRKRATSIPVGVTIDENSGYAQLNRLPANLQENSYATLSNTQTNIGRDEVVTTS